MEYLNSIGCKKEPFAETAGEEFYLSQPMRDTLEKLTHSIRLGAGLHIVTGQDGSGKTSLIDQLSHKFSTDKNIIVLTLHQPQFNKPEQFFTTLAGAFKSLKPTDAETKIEQQEEFNALFQKKCLQEKKSVLLLIDNGHTLPDFCLQALEGLYGHHADCRRMLQAVICGESSLLKKIRSISSLNSRVVFNTTLKALSFKDTRELIQFHLERAAANPGSSASLFSFASQWAIYRLTRGNPKQVIDLCHFIVLTLVIENRKRADWFMALRCGSLLIPNRAKKLQLIRAGSLSSFIVLMLVFGLWSEQIKTLTAPQIQPTVKPPVAQKGPGHKPQAVEAVNAAPEAVQQEIVKDDVTPEPATTTKEVKATTAAEEQVAAVTPPEEIAAVEEISSPEAVPAEPVATAPEPEPAEELAAIPTPTIKEKRHVMPGDTFLVMIQKVYGPGHLEPHFVEQVIAANPQLKNPHNLAVGDEVSFPVLAAKEKPVVVKKKTESLVSKKLDRDLQPVDSPGLIGKLSILPGDTLGVLIRGVYGPFSFNPEYTAKVVAANSHLRNPDRLEVGETIYFPDLPITPEVGLPAKPTPLDSRKDIPEFLGEIIAIENETFGDMVRRIYGPYSYNEENTEKVLAANPGLKNPNLLSVGQKVRFPAILVSLTPEALDVWWVKIITHDNLQSAYRFLRVYSQWAPPMLIIPSRNSSGQVLFNVLLEDYFADEQAALAAINELPASITSDAKSLHGLDPNIFYYWMKQKD